MAKQHMKPMIADWTESGQIMSKQEAAKTPRSTERTMIAAFLERTSGTPL